jgi:hypothetical protein
MEMARKRLRWSIGSASDSLSPKSSPIREHWTNMCSYMTTWELWMIFTRSLVVLPAKISIRSKLWYVPSPVESV